MRRPRSLSPEDRALWEQITRQVAPLKGRRGTAPADDPQVPSPPRPVPVKAPVKAPLAVRDPVPNFRLGEKADHRRGDDLLPGLAESMARAPVLMDAKTHGRMKRGKLVPEGRIDLHGMVLSEAHPALLGFILSSHAAGKRLVLVITGKGKPKDFDAPMPVRHGVLRHQVPQWLNLPPLRQVVLQITPAHISHGGAGAYYVYLRR